MFKKILGFAAVLLVLFGAVLALTGTAMAGDEARTDEGILQKVHQAIQAHVHWFHEQGGHHQKGHGHHGLRGLHGMHGAQLPQLIAALDLTPEQQQLMKEVHEAFAAAMHSHGDARSDLHDLLVAGVEKGQLSAADLRSEAASHLELLSGLADQLSDPVAELVNSLDEEQRAQVLHHIAQIHG